MKKKQRIKLKSYGSSETIRKAPNFCFDDFYKYGHADHVPRIQEDFLEWFIGFFEGDGILYFSQKKVSTRVRNGIIYNETVCERLHLSIVQKERAILEKICFTFGFGRVSSFQHTGKIFWRWTLDSQKSFQRIAFLLSGNLILEKRQKQFLIWVEKGQKKNLFKFPFNKQKPWSSRIGLTNGWLSGFIDSEGCFYASFKLTLDQRKQISDFPLSKSQWSEKHYHLFDNIQWKCPLHQKMTLTQYSTKQTNSVFKQILYLFNGTSFYIFQKKSIKKQTNAKYVRVEFGRLVSQKLILCYLTKYPLKTIKNVSFKRWCRVYNRRKKGVHLSPKGTKKLFRLVKAINNHSKKNYL